MEYQKSCGAVVYREKNNDIYFLLLQSKPGRYWGFPKGHVEDGETDEQTARREIYEETGLTVEFIEGFREETQYKIGENITKTVILFLARAASDNVNLPLEEIENYRWLSKDRVFELLSFENLSGILKKAIEFIEKKL